jgi:branched-chain amino acid transport system substrate-binding protein
VRAALAWASLVLAFAPAAHAQSLTIWSSGPLTGAGGAEARDVRDGERLAWEEAGKTAGGAAIAFRARTDATRQAGNWDPGTEARNARRAARDDSTIAYLGAFNSGASAIAIPILNEAGVPTISPTSTYVGLTRAAGAARGEPAKYYPSGARTFFRVAPADHLQAAAIAKVLADRGVHRLALAHDGEDYGRGVGGLVAAAAKARGIAVVLNARVGSRGRNAASIARRVRAAHADGFSFIGVTATGGPRVVRAVGRAVRRIPLVEPDGCLDSAFTRHVGSAASRVLITADPVPAALRATAGADFAKRFRARWRRSASPWAAYGFEAMALALDAINRAGAAADRRAAVLAALAATRDRDSVLGRYSIDGQGDTTLSTYGVYRVRNRLPLFAAVVDSAT